MKTLAILVMAGALADPLIAQAANIEPMTGWQQFGVCGGCLAVLALYSRTVSKMGDDCRTGMKEAATQNRVGMERLSEQIKEGQDSQIEFLREVFNKRP
jgi:hypothetical protein